MKQTGASDGDDAENGCAYVRVYDCWNGSVKHCDSRFDDGASVTFFLCDFLILLRSVLILLCDLLILSCDLNDFSILLCDSNDSTPLLDENHFA